MKIHEVKFPFLQLRGLSQVNVVRTVILSSGLGFSLWIMNPVGNHTSFWALLTLVPGGKFPGQL